MSGRDEPGCEHPVGDERSPSWGHTRHSRELFARGTGGDESTTALKGDSTEV